MRVLQISSASAFGGGERHFADLANGLQDSGNEVFVALRPASPLRHELTNIAPTHITELPLRNSLDALSARALERLVRNHQVQIVHAHMARDYPLAAYAVRRNRGCRLVVTRHVLFPLSRLHAITLSKAARVIAVSHAVARLLQAQRLVPPDRIVVIPNGIQVSRFTSRGKHDGLSLRHQWGVPDDAVLVGSVGELTPLKGHAEFLQAAAVIAQETAEAHFVIAGLDNSSDGATRASLQKQIDELGLATRTRVTGWVENLADLYAALDVFVSASYTESFGLAIAEAMATGTPVVATKTEGACEVISTTDCGVLVQLGNVNELAAGVVELIRDKQKARQVSQAAQERIKNNFSLDRMITSTIVLYREILGLS